MGFPTFRRARLFLIAGRRHELQGKPKRKARWEAKVADLSTLGGTLRAWDGFGSSLPAAAISRKRGLHALGHPHICKSK